jgi:predicted O-methyltransferase YrrM
MQKIREYPDTGEFQAPSILIDFLSSRSFTVWEGQLVAGQVMSMLETLANNPSITRCLEIGFNGGLSAATILSARPNISLVSVDIGLHEYVLKAKNTIDSKFPGRHTLVIGDSLQAVPQLAKLMKIL